MYQGSGRNFNSWARLLHSKLNERHDIMVMDLRNHGSSVRDVEMDYELMARDVLYSLESMGIDKAHIIGHRYASSLLSSFIIILITNTINYITNFIIFTNYIKKAWEAKLLRLPL